jgi:hypothetical protein
LLAASSFPEINCSGWNNCPCYYSYKKKWEETPIPDP